MSPHTLLSDALKKSICIAAALVFPLESSDKRCAAMGVASEVILPPWRHYKGESCEWRRPTAAGLVSKLRGGNPMPPKASYTHSSHPQHHRGGTNEEKLERGGYDLRWHSICTQCTSYAYILYSCGTHSSLSNLVAQELEGGRLQTLKGSRKSSCYECFHGKEAWRFCRNTDSYL